VLNHPLGLTGEVVSWWTFWSILWFLRISAVRSLGALGHLRRRWRDLRTRSGLLWTECAVAAAVFGRRLRLLSFSSAICRFCLVVLVTFTPVPCSCSALLRCLRCNSLQSCPQRRRGNYVKEVTEITSSRLINPRYICAQLRPTRGTSKLK